VGVSTARHQVRLDLTPGQLGTLLLTTAARSILELPASGAIIARLGTRRTVEFAATLFAFGLALAAIGVSFLGSVWPTGFGMFLMGLGMGCWDVAMEPRGRRGRAPGRPRRSCRGSTPRSAGRRSWVP
jgi:MFS family permease